jgi:hypothetical protein
MFYFPALVECGAILCEYDGVVNHIRGIKMGMREEFEAWAANHYLLGECVTDLEDGEYFDPEKQYAWEAWQASRAALVIELPDIDSEGPSYVYHVDAVHAALTDAGVSYK